LAALGDRARGLEHLALELGRIEHLDPGAQAEDASARFIG
jgi:hypothetical protein